MNEGLTPGCPEGLTPGCPGGLTTTYDDGLAVVYKRCQYMKYILNEKGLAIEGWGWRKDSPKEAYQFLFNQIFKEQIFPTEDGVKDGWVYIGYSNLLNSLQKSPQDCFEVLTNVSDNQERNKELAAKRELFAFCIQYETGDPIYD
jgi:hypothetical protein